MRDKKPEFLIVVGAVCFALGSIAPNGVNIFNYAEIIGLYNLIVTAMQGFGLGILIVGAVRFFKAQKA